MFQINSIKDAQEFVKNISKYSVCYEGVCEFTFITDQPGPVTTIHVRIKNGIWIDNAKSQYGYSEDFTIYDPIQYVWKYRKEINFYLENDEDLQLYNNWGGKRSGSGRHLAGEELKKNHSIKFSDSEWEEVKKKAEAEEISASEYIRKLVLE